VVPRVAARGRLVDWFDQPALLEPAGLVGAGARLAEVRPGMEFEVELDDVNVHARRVLVKAIRRVEADLPANADRRG